MSVTKETIYTKDETKLQMKVVREFEAPLPVVWEAWTDSKVLDKWWAPDPWKAHTKSMDFKEGGSWFYYMEGPEGLRHYSKTSYRKIIHQESFGGLDAFTDENENQIADMPSQQWETCFFSINGGTRVEVLITFPSIEAMNQTIEMGFEEGFRKGHENLDALLSHN